jgi:hypothetical protein
MALIPLPTNVGYGTVTGRFILAYKDSADSGLEPDAEPAKGYVIFTASPIKLLDSTALDGSTLAPVTILPAPVTADLDSSGYIIGYSGNRGVRLVATNDTQLNPSNWTWKVDFRLTDEADVPVSLPSFSFGLPEGTTVDLTTVSPVPGANGTYYTVGATGPTGPATVLSVSSTTTGDAGTDASVTVSGTAPTQSLAFTIPRGDQGEQGNPGVDALWNFSGEYSASIAYDLGDVVTYQGSSYYRSANGGEGIAPTDVDYWDIIASKGEEGPAGSSILIKGQVANVGNLPTTGNTVNDAWIVTADGHLYIWDGTEFIDSGNVQGPPGVGVPIGGDTHMFLKKLSSDDYSTEWTDTIEGGTA